MQPPGEYMHGATVGGVGGVRNKLIVRGQREPFVQRKGIVRFQYALAAVIELAVADETPRPPAARKSR